MIPDAFGPSGLPDDYDEDAAPLGLIQEMVSRHGQFCAAATLPVTKMTEDGVERAALFYIACHQVTGHDPDEHFSMTVMLESQELDCLIQRLSAVRALLDVPELEMATAEDIERIMSRHIPDEDGGAQ